MVTQQHVLSDGLPIYRRLQSDDQDSVRLLTVEDLIVIAKQLTDRSRFYCYRVLKHAIHSIEWSLSLVLFKFLFNRKRIKLLVVYSPALCNPSIVNLPWRASSHSIFEKSKLM
ncbi:hypothetical protein DEU56DRAFT_747221 [Suillus clintonianus]|uniref:uncharacterized protein n=1 Tax=Suillus clintonianus TaxID=1904413 RepID=UPI001B87A0F1|nr:uncharacterized protein DEU56DRAFT_747221 [Suillus clintonianus]KAG2119449.1 hypothetical protein DEU56DRAFT_747221 [Suillus clintonianus]